VEVIFVAWSFLAINDSTYRPKKSWLMILFTVFLLAVGVSTILSPNPYKSFWSNFERMDGYITLIHLFLLFVVMGSVFRDAKHWRGWWKGAAFTSAIMCIYAFFQLAGKLTINQGGVRVDGTLGNAAYLATYLLFSFFLTLFLFAHEKKIGIKILYSVLGISQLVIIYYTATRGAILGILGGLALMALILAVRGNGKIKKAGIATIVLLILVPIVFFAVRNTSVVKNSPVLNRFSALSIADFKTQGRYFVWPMALKGIVDKPVFGWGIESFNYVFNKYYDPRMYNQEPWFDRAHNMFLDWLVAGGIIGGGLYISICALSLWKAFKDKDEDPEFKGESSAILVALLFAYFFQGLFLFDNIVSYIYFISILAYLHARSNSEWPKIDGWQPGEATKRVVPSVLSIVLVFSLYFGIWKPMKAGAYVIDALLAEQNQKPADALNYLKAGLDLHTLGDSEIREQLIAYSPTISQSSDQTLKQNYYTLLTTQMDEQLARSPDDARYRLLYASGLNQLGLPDQALVQLEKAKVLSPGKQAIYFEMSRSYILKKDFPDAISVLKTAYNLEPDNDEATVNLGITYLYMGDSADANATFAKASKGYDFISDDRLLGAYVDLNMWNNVVNILEERAKRNPNDVNNYISLASAFLKEGDKADAISALNVVGSLRPDYKSTADAYILQIKQGKNPTQ
jgi:O-antigen ligase/tetratricopeptide (TPR) repeat protein